MDLKNKTIIITGASSGIGAAAARIFTEEGASVVLGARRGDKLEELTEKIGSDQAVFLAGDVTDESYNQALVELAKSKFGKLDGAFNNAGIIGELGPVTHMESKNWLDVISTNLTSAFFASKYQIAAMQEQGTGSIVFTSSFVGYSNAGMPGMGAYAASKAGLIGLTQSLAAEHGAEEIRVNALLPGGTKTDMAGNDCDVHAYITGLHSLKRMANVDEIAQAALFLLSSKASFVTGSAMTVDGGVSVRLA